MNLGATYLIPTAVLGGGFAMEGYWVWCGSVVKAQDAQYHLFASRWPRTRPFHPGWLTSSEIVRAVADTPEGPYRFAGVVLPARGAEYWDGCSTHNPSIHFHQGRYYIFYMGTTYPFAPPAGGEELAMQDPRVITARTNKRIGVVVAECPEGPWVRMNHPVLKVEPGTWYSYLVSNPAPWIETDGSVKLVFKAREYVGHAYSGFRLGVAGAREPLGPYQVLSGQPLFAAERNSELEDPFLWKQEGIYHLIAKDISGSLSGQEGAAIHATSRDTMQWELSDPPIAYHRSWGNGALAEPAHMERPFLLLENGRPSHLFAAVAEGQYHFRDLCRSWNQVFRVQPSNQRARDAHDVY